MFQPLPLFFAYQVFDLLYGLGAMAVTYLFPAAYVWFAIACYSLDGVFYVLVLFEIARAVERFNRKTERSHSSGFLLAAVVTLLLWQLVPWQIPHTSQWMWLLDIRVLQATQIGQVGALLALLIWSAGSKLRWPERELRIVIGMGFWAMVGFSVLILHTHGFYGREDYWLDQLLPVSSAASLAYWVHWFWVEPQSAGRFGEQGS